MTKCNLSRPGRRVVPCALTKEGQITLGSACREFWLVFPKLHDDFTCSCPSLPWIPRTCYREQYSFCCCISFFDWCGSLLHKWFEVMSTSLSLSLSLSLSFSFSFSLSFSLFLSLSLSLSLSLPLCLISAFSRSSSENHGGGGGGTPDQDLPASKSRW